MHTLFTLLVCALLSMVAAQGYRTIYVDPTLGQDIPTCYNSSTPSNPCLTVQYAQSNLGDAQSVELQLAAGIYSGDENCGVAFLVSNISLVGQAGVVFDCRGSPWGMVGYNGSAYSFSQIAFQGYICPALNFRFLSRTGVVNINNCTFNATLGPAVLVESSYDATSAVVNIADSIFLNSNSGYAAVSATYCSLNVLRSSFAHNRGTNGAIYFLGRSLMIDSCNFTQNIGYTATVYIQNILHYNAPIIRNSNFIQNKISTQSSTTFGVAVLLNGWDQLDLSGSYFSNNCIHPAANDSSQVACAYNVPDLQLYPCHATVNGSLGTYNGCHDSQATTGKHTSNASLTQLCLLALTAVLYAIL